MHNYLKNMGVRGKLVLLISLLVFVVLGSVVGLVLIGTSHKVNDLVTENMNSRADAFQRAEQYRMRDRGHILLLISRSLMEQTGEFPDQEHACTYFQGLLKATDSGGSDPNDSPRIGFAALRDANGAVVAAAVNSPRGVPVNSSDIPCGAGLMSDLPDVSSVLSNTPNSENSKACAPANETPARVHHCPLKTNWKDEANGGALFSIYAARIAKVALPGTPPASPLGTVTVGYKINDGYADMARKRAGGSTEHRGAVDVVYSALLGADRRETIFASSSSRLAGTLNDESLHGGANGSITESLKDDHFRADQQEYFLKRVNFAPVGIQVKNPENIRVALIESYSAQMQPFRALQRNLNILAVVSVLIGIGMGIIFSAPLVKPLIGLAKVANDVEEGKYDAINQLKVQHRYAFESRDEIGTLCRAFEEMVAGLKKRNAMTKFMSAAALKSMGESGTFNQAGERMWMVVLFSDIRGFTKYSEGRDPETVVQRLNEVLGIQAEYVKRHGGDIDKFIGDAMVAWFTGADRCRRAVTAATEMMAGLSSRIGESAGRQIGVGIHLGEVIVGALGAQDRQDYTAIGSSVNLAARLCSAAKSGQILISQTVVTELDGSVMLNPLPPVSLKGFAEPTPVYEVVQSSVPRPAAIAREDMEMTKAAPPLVQ